MADKPKILVVEDEPSLRLLVRKVLERSGFEVLEAASGVAALAFGLMPAVAATRSSLVQANRGEFSSGYRPSRLRNALVVVQVTVCALLLISAAIALRGERVVASQDPGYDARGAFAIRLPDRLRAAVAGQLRADPRFASVGAVSDFPTAARALGAGQPVGIDYSLASPEYFEALHIRLMRGRNFTEDEAKSEANVAIVSETAARRLWPGEEAVGRTVTLPKPALYFLTTHPLTAVVVGVARDTFESWDDQGQPLKSHLYFPADVGSKHTVSLLVGMKGPIGIEPARRAIQAAADRAAPGAADEIESMEETQAARLYPFRILFGITGFLGGLALLMTLSGVYGVLSYLVSQRRREFGIRIALGAAGDDVAGMVLRQSLKLAAFGVGAGAALAWGVAKIVGNNLQPIDPLDWRGYVGGVAAVLCAAAVAAWVPARRAVRVDPAVTLRCD